MTTCISSPLPTYPDIKTLFASYYELPDTSALPELPTLPNPMFSNLNFTSMQTEMYISEMQNWQVMSTIMSIWTKLTEYVPMELPVSPDLDINLEDILQIQPSNMLETINTKYIDAGNSFEFSQWIPNPIFPSFPGGTFSLPSMEMLHAMQIATRAYLMMVVDYLFQLVTQVTDYLVIPGMPALPEWPTLEELENMTLAMTGGIRFPTLNDVKQLSVPGFEFQSDMTDPLMPFCDWPVHNYIQSLKNFMLGIVTENVQKVLDFVQNDMGIEIPITYVCG